MDSLRPGQIALIAGGVLLLISGFLPWWSVGSGRFSVDANAWDFGLTGIFVLAIGVIALLIGLSAVVEQIRLPDGVLGFSMNQLAMALGISTAVYTFSLLFRGNSAQIGTILSLVAAVAIAVGGYLEAGTGGAEAPRTI